MLVGSCCYLLDLLFNLENGGSNSSETLVNVTHTTRYYIAEDGTFHSHFCGDLRCNERLFTCVLLIKLNVVSAPGPGAHICSPVEMNCV